jgi:hypothetical protein
VAHVDRRVPAGRIRHAHVDGSRLERLRRQQPGGTFVYGRGDLGRTPMLSQTDLFIQHDLKIGPLKHLNLNANITNVFDQMTVLDLNHAPYRDQLLQPGLSTVGTSSQLSPSDAFFFNGFDVTKVVADMRAAGATMRDNPLFL